MEYLKDKSTNNSMHNNDEFLQRRSSVDSHFKSKIYPILSDCKDMWVGEYEDNGDIHTEDLKPSSSRLRNGVKNFLGGIKSMDFMPSLEPQDEKSAGIVMKASEIMQSWIKTNKVDRILDSFVEDLSVYPYAIVGIKYDPKRKGSGWIEGKKDKKQKKGKILEGDVALYNVSPWDFRYDPSIGSNVQDSKYLMIKQELNVIQVLDLPFLCFNPLKKLAMLNALKDNGTTINSNIDFDDSSKQVSEYGGQGTDETVYDVTSYYYKDFVRNTVNIRYYINDDFVTEQKDVGLGMDYPFIVKQFNKIGGTMLGKSLIWEGMAAQKKLYQIEDTENIYISRMLAPETYIDSDLQLDIDAIKDDREAGIGGVYSVYAGGKQLGHQIHEVQPPDIPQSLLEIKNGVLVDIDESMGQNEETRGQATHSQTTSGGTQMVLDHAGRNETLLISQIEDGYEDIFEMLFKGIKKWYKDGRRVHKSRRFDEERGGFVDTDVNSSEFNDLNLGKPYNGNREVSRDWLDKDMSKGLISIKGELDDKFFKFNVKLVDQSKGAKQQRMNMVMGIVGGLNTNKSLMDMKGHQWFEILEFNPAIINKLKAFEKQNKKEQKQNMQSILKNAMNNPEMLKSLSQGLKDLDTKRNMAEGDISVKKAQAAAKSKKGKQ